MGLLDMLYVLDVLDVFGFELTHTNTKTQKTV